MSGSGKEMFTDDDQELLNHLDSEIESADDAEELEEIARDIKSKFFELKAEFRQYQNQVDARFDEIERRLEDSAPDKEKNYHQIHFYENMGQEEREKQLSTSERVAVTLHEDWHEIAWKLGDDNNRRVGVDSKSKANAKYNPSRLKHRLKQHVGKDLQSIEVYRGLKQLAKLSGGEEHVEDVTSRVHVKGGLYSYEERPTSDNSDVRRVLWRNGE